MESEEEKRAREAARAQRASQGDQGAVIEIYEESFDDLYDYFRNKVKGKSEAEDLTSETFTRAIKELLLGHYTSQGKPFRNWLFGIAKRVLQEHRREERKRSGIDSLDNLPGHNEPLSEEEDVLDTVMQQET